MFDPAAYKGQTLPQLLADLERLGDFCPLPRDADWRLVDRLAGGVAPDPIELPTASYRCEKFTPVTDRPVVDLPNIQLEEYIGGGKFGWVYAGSVVSTGVIVAVKVLRADYADAGGMAAREALVASSLRHPHILAVYDINRIPRYWIIIMELIRGASFSECPVEDATTLAQMQRLASALQHMAERNVVHRDIKPANIILRQRSCTPVLVDFGLAVNTTTYANDGTFAGTPYFMCPEGLHARCPTPAFDAYGLGVTFCHLLLGQQMVGPADLRVLVEFKRNGEFENLLQAELDRVEDGSVVPFLRRLVARDPERRIEAIGELATANKQ